MDDDLTSEDYKLLSLMNREVTQDDVDLVRRMKRERIPLTIENVKVIERISYDSTWEEGCRMKAEARQRDWNSALTPLEIQKKNSIIPWNEKSTFKFLCDNG